MTFPNTTDPSAGVLVRKVTDRDLPDLSATLAAAFFEDPVTQWWMPDFERRLEILPAFFRLVAEVNLPHDELYTTDDSVAGAVWIPPDCQPKDDEVAELMPRFEHVAAEYAEGLFQILLLLDEKHPPEPHYYLFFLGTRPEWQSRGIGSAVMQAVLDRCDREAKPAYLEASSEGNKRLYLRHGFEVTEEIRLPDGPPLWRMWRVPK